MLKQRIRQILLNWIDFWFPPQSHTIVVIRSEAEIEREVRATCDAALEAFRKGQRPIIEDGEDTQPMVLRGEWHEPKR